MERETRVRVKGVKGDREMIKRVRVASARSQKGIKVVSDKKAVKDRTP